MPAEDAYNTFCLRRCALLYIYGVPFSSPSSYSGDSPNLINICHFSAVRQIMANTKNVERWNKKFFWVLIMWHQILLSWTKRVFLKDKNLFCDNMTNFHPRLSGSLTNPSLQRKMICHDWSSWGKVNLNFYFCCSLLRDISCIFKCALFHMSDF